ncbi:hypothetical protein BGX29_012205 [Mortierella sp. GBA35]|nr:hypothetical protein BGX29_012205 [Mortierella sp. GBA35]
MDPSQMSEEQARDTVAKILDEMRRTLNAVGDYSESEDEYETDSDVEGNSSNNSTANNTSEGNSRNKANEGNNNNEATGDNTTEAKGSSKDSISMSYTHPPPGSDTNGAADEPEKKKKKKKKKAKKAKIELEDFLAAEDGADQPAENPYDISKSAAERVEIAVTRFRKNRKFSPIRSQILSVYLDYGGIQTGPKMFQGGGVKSGGPDDDGDGEADFEAMSAGVDRVDLPEEGQQVDFTNVVTTFLSQYFLRSTGWVDMVYYRDTPIVVAALLNYFLVRDVLPEYKEDLKAALAVAEKAKIELPLCKMISSGWPSRYDKACSMLYGGEWFEYLENSWQGEAAAIETVGMDMSTARRIVKSVVEPDVDLTTLTVGPREFLELEVVHVPAVDLNEGDDAVVDAAQEEEDDAAKVELVDRMILGETGKGPADPVTKAAESAEAIVPALEVTEALMTKYVDVTLAEWNPEVLREGQKPLSERRKLHVYFDPNVSTKLLLGMRIAAYVYTLSNGMSYLEQAEVYPTYHLEADEIEELEDEWDE